MLFLSEILDINIFFKNLIWVQCPEIYIQIWFELIGNIFFPVYFYFTLLKSNIAKIHIWAGFMTMLYLQLCKLFILAFLVFLSPERSSGVLLLTCPAQVTPMHYYNYRTTVYSAVLWETERERDRQKEGQEWGRETWGGRETDRRKGGSERKRDL